MTVLIVTPPPTPNGPLHVGHLSGPYVAADVAARHLRATGRAVLTQSGLDANQNYVLTRAESRGEPVERTVAHFSGLVRDAFDKARIRYDVLADPTVDAAYGAAVGDLLDAVVDAKVARMEATTLGACGGCGRVLHHARVAGTCPTCGQGAAGGTCEGCGSFLTAATLTGARSTCCDAPPRAVEATVPVLHLEEHREALCEWWTRAVLPPRLRRLLGSYLDAGLPDVPLAYPTDWGIGWGDGLRIDVWAEMAVANVFLPARHLDPGVRTLEDCVAAWRGIDEQWIFLGIDNAFYYAVLIPAVHLAVGLPAPTGLVVNEFYRLTGSKFSTSRDHAIWAHEWLAEEDPGLVRAYVSWDRPDRYESDFSPEAYAAFTRWFAEGGGCVGDDRLADIELTRGEQALRLDAFDPAQAVRAALSARGRRPERAARLLAPILGVEPAEG